MPVHRAGRQVEGIGNFRDGHADEVAHLNYFRRLRILLCQRRQRVVHSQQFLGRHGHGDARLVQFVTNELSAVFDPLFAPGFVDQDLLHRRGSGLEEMPAVGELLASVSSDLQPSFVHERRGLQRLTGFLISHADSRQLAQFLIDQREKLICSFGIARINGAEQLGDVGHEPQSSSLNRNGEPYDRQRRDDGPHLSSRAPMTVLDREEKNRLDSKTNRTKQSSNHTLVAILMGSDSDWPVMKAAADALKDFGIASEAKVISAHRTPRDLEQYASGARDRGIRVFICGAGGAAHLPGVTAAFTTLPVIGVPIQGKALEGMDSLLSIVQMPPGVPVATVGINAAKNAGLLAAQIIGSGDPVLQKKLDDFKLKLAEESRAKNRTIAA